jgi:hypothetical protein
MAHGVGTVVMAALVAVVQALVLLYRVELGLLVKVTMAAARPVLEALTILAAVAAVQELWEERHLVLPQEVVEQD